MGLGIFRQQQWLAKLILPLWLWDAQQKFEHLKAFLSVETQILDIGTGLGTVPWVLQQKGLQITTLDIANYSLIAEVNPIIYDGQKMPFADQSFTTALILTVLHHTAEPLTILKEAKRVARQIIIIEDIYENWLQKYLTFAGDSLVNLEFFDHPHSNETHENWLRIFQELNFTVTTNYSYRFLGFFRQAVYVLENPLL